MPENTLPARIIKSTAVVLAGVVIGLFIGAVFTASVIAKVIRHAAANLVNPA